MSAAEVAESICGLHSKTQGCSEVSAGTLTRFLLQLLCATRAAVLIQCSLCWLWLASIQVQEHQIKCIDAGVTRRRDGQTKIATHRGHMTDSRGAWDQLQLPDEDLS